ncbi:transglutaminase family protein [Sneathiella sp.]|uniref:transglutaminase family protein n=1 Tax=Sneathiella sp. TaxID=1964365 RepID=UPI002FE39AA0
MLLKISHLTRYRYEQPVRYALQQLRVTPKSGAGQEIRAWDVTIEGGRQEAEFTDQFNNRVLLVSANPGEREIAIHCTGEVETTDLHGILGVTRGFAPLWFFSRPTALTTPGEGIGRLVNALQHETFDGDVALLHRLSTLIGEVAPYRTGETHAGTTAEEALATANGVCQDHAHIFLAAARSLGFPARYVSGYLMMNDRIDQEATHAWAEVCLADLGWVGFDVSNGISPDDRYVRVATGLDYRDAAPIVGFRLGEGGECLDVTLQVQQQ